MDKVRLGEVAAERKETCKGSKNGFPIVGLEHLSPEEVTLSGWNENIDNTFTKLFREGDVLFGRRRAYLKKAAVAPFDGICSGDITVIKAIPERILPELLPFVIQNDSLFDYAIEKSAGSLSPRVKWEHLRNYEFELPNLDKQRELAKVLWAMDATRNSYQKLIQKTDYLVKGQFIDMFGELGKNSFGFEKKPIEDVTIELFAGGDKPVDNSVERTEEYPFPVYSNGIERDGLLCYGKEYRISVQALTISARGSVGYSRIREPFFTPVVRLLTLVPNKLINIKYLKIFIDLQNLTGTGSSQGQLTLPEFRKIQVLLPPKETQDRFADIVENLEKLEFELIRSLRELNSTFKKLIIQSLV